jgi:predicted NBD/HSP70 family sugar kinase
VTAGQSPAGGLGNSNDSVRRHNLAVLMRLVHHSGAVSRAQLTRLTGLNRSTIAALVAELVERDLVRETDPDSRNQVGRPSPVVVPGERPLVITINPEIDAITVGIVGLGGTVLHRVRQPVASVPTVAEASTIAAGMIDALREQFDLDRRAVGIGVAVPGLVRASDGLVRLAPHLGWVDEPFTAMLEDATGFAVSAANDARLGTRAESIFGAGRGLTDMVYLNGGASGIGGGAIVGGALLGGVSGYAGEFGHTLVTSDGTLCHCGARGCLETEVRRSTLLNAVGLVDADADVLESALAASTGDDAVRREADRQIDTLAITLRNAVNTLNPQLIVLGGFLGSLYTVDPGRLDAAVAAQSLSAAWEGVRIARAELGSNLLLIGAAELAFEGILGNPSSFS